VVDLARSTTLGGPLTSEATARHGRVLRFRARAGLLPELTAQTYDEFYKAVREAVLNALDAGASEVLIDFTGVLQGGPLIVTDDGSGMSEDELESDFFGVGGSEKVKDSEAFGRFGIGSFAVLSHAEKSVIRTRRQGDPRVTVAEIAKPSGLGMENVRQTLDDVEAGTIWHEIAGPGTPPHFTRMELWGLSDTALREISDPVGFLSLIDRLRRVLPLPWREGALLNQLHDQAPEVAEALAAHCDTWSGRVVVRHPAVGEYVLSRKVLGGDGDDHGEAWVGELAPVWIRLWEADGGDRQMLLGGYLASLRSVTPMWSGVTCRVQNVAVTEGGFFDMSRDPGFLRYIHGEIFILTEDVGPDLIRIDRASFNRSSPMYRAIRHAMQDQIQSFKVSSVQRRQRNKAKLRSDLSEHESLCSALLRISLAVGTEGDGPAGLRTVVRPGVLQQASVSALTLVEAAGGLAVPDDGPPTKVRPSRIDVDESGRIIATVDERLLKPHVQIGGVRYEVRLIHVSDDAPAVLVWNRPRVLVFNLLHAMFANRPLAFATEIALAVAIAEEEATALGSSRQAVAGFTESLVAILGG
jgi:hypothetical protein